MTVTNTFLTAVGGVIANKLRATLTALGIIIGVASVIATLALGQGARVIRQYNSAIALYHMLQARAIGEACATGDTSFRELALFDGDIAHQAHNTSFFTAEGHYAIGHLRAFLDVMRHHGFAARP